MLSIAALRSILPFDTSLHPILGIRLRARTMAKVSNLWLQNGSSSDPPYSIFRGRTVDSCGDSKGILHRPSNHHGARDVYRKGWFWNRCETRRVKGKGCILTFQSSDYQHSHRNFCKSSPKCSWMKTNTAHAQDSIGLAVTSIKLR
jgi:hypothetical protein